MDEEFREIEILDSLGNEYHYFNVEYFWDKDNFELIDQKGILHRFNFNHIIKYSIIKLKEQINKKDYVMVNGEQNYFDCEEEKL